MGRLLLGDSKAFSRWMIHGPSTAAHRAIKPGFQWVFVTLQPPRFSFVYYLVDRQIKTDRKSVV